MLERRVRPAIQEKTVKAMAALSRERATVLPTVPSAHEQGLTDFDASIWFALFFPKDTPATIIRRLSAAIGGTLDTKSVRERLEANGLRIAVPMRRTPDYLSRFVASEIKKYAGPIKASGATLEN